MTIRDLAAAWRFTLATLQRRYASLLTFTGIAAMFHFTTAVCFPLIGGMDAVQSVLHSFSPGLRQLLKIAPNLQGGFSLRDYLAFTWIHPFFIGLCAAFVVGRSADALAGEIETGAVYLVLSRPVPRWTLVLGRVGEVGIGLAVILLTSWLGMIIGVHLAKLGPLPLDRYAVLVTTAWLLFMALSAVALIVSSAASRAGVAAAIGTVWTIATYVLDVIPVVLASPIAWLNPWHHYFPQGIIASDSMQGAGLVVLVGWTVAAVAIAMWLYGRRDLV